jgi:hypothetical protein
MEIVLKQANEIVLK